MAGPTRVVVVRSGLEESVHEVDVAVVDTAGSLIASSGDPTRLAYARSCMKPLQAARQPLLLMHVYARYPV